MFRLANEVMSGSAVAACLAAPRKSRKRCESLIPLNT